MALIQCPECLKSVSDVALACPGCGAPVSIRRDVASTGAHVQTVEETAKRFKLHVLISAFLFWGGLIGGLTAAGEDKAADWYGAAMTAGMTWYFVTRFRIWWHHK